MKKFSKIVLASSIVLGFFVTPELFNAKEAQAQESIEPYYNYDGMAILRIKVDLY